MNTVVLGIGNPILTDDGVGIKIARRVKELKPDLDVEETSEIGMALLELVAGYDKVIIIDSVKTVDGQPGELYKLGLEELKPSSDFPTGSHGIDIATAFELGRLAGYKMPEQVCLYAVEVADNETFGEDCTETIEAAMPSIVEKIIREEQI